MKKVKVSEVEYNNFLEFIKARNEKPSLITVDEYYKGGHIFICPNCEKRAINMIIKYNDKQFYKTFDIITEKVWDKEETGSFFNRKVEWKLTLKWKDGETMEKVYDYAKTLLDAIDELSVKEQPQIVIRPIIQDFTE